MSDSASLRNTKAQSATEYLLTYGWAFLIAVVVIAALYLFVFAPSGIVPSSCSFQSGAYCQDLVLGSSSSLSKLAALLSNTNPYPIITPQITVNISGIAPIQGTCSPNFVLPGGAIVCSATITPAISQSALASGTFIVSYIPCPGGNVSLCSSNQRQFFPGSFNTHSSPLLSPITVNIILTAQNSSQIALSSVKDKLTANVKLLGTPLSGATVNFTTNSLNAVLTASVATTDGSGNAVVYLSDPVAENVLVRANFSNSTSNTIVQFLPAVCFTFSVGSASPSANALTIDGVGYSSFPQNLCYAQGSSHSYSFASTVAGSAGIQYAFSSASGCGASGQSGTIIASTNCTLTATYTTQYLLTTSSSPGAGGTATPSTQYYNTGTQVTLGETPNGGYFFLSWTGSGTGSFSGNTAAPTIGINGVITQQANFYSTSTTSTTSSTSTSTVPANPGCGSYVGDAIYSSTTSLTCNLIASNAIIVQPGVTLDECGQYIQANIALYNYGNITDLCGGGAAGGGGGGGYWTTTYLGGGYYGHSAHPGSAGSAGGSGASRTSSLFGITLSGGLGGAGGGGGGPGSTCSGCYYSGDSGGSGGKGGGIVEIYASNLINYGNIVATGAIGGTGDGAAQSHGGCIDCSYANGGGGGGEGGSGGTVFYAYTTLTNTGSIQANAGGQGGGGYEQTGSGSGGSSSGGGTGGSGNSGAGGSGGSTTQSSGNVVTRTWP